MLGKLAIAALAIAIAVWLAVQFPALESLAACLVSIGLFVFAQKRKRAMGPRPVAIAAPAYTEHWELAIFKAGIRMFQPDNVEEGDLFVPAPAEIGQLVSAHTSLKISKKHKSILTRISIGIGAGLAICALITLATAIAWSLPSGALVGIFILSVIVIVPMAVPLGVYLTRFRHFCAYVGKEGIALYRCSGSRRRITTRSVMRYSDAVDLRVVTTHHYHNNLYDLTAYEHKWIGADFEKLFVVSGSHASHPSLPPIHDVYHFALAAETEWSQQLWARVSSDLRTEKVCVFRLRGHDRLVCASKYVEFHIKDNIRRFSPADFEEILVKDGSVAFKEVGSHEEWFSSSGTQKLWLADLGNAQLFFLLLEQVYNLRVVYE